MDPQITQPNQPQGQFQQQQPAQLSQYESHFIAISNSIDANFLLKGMEYRMIKWRMKQLLQKAYDEKKTLPDFNQIPISNFI